jgi:Pyruvate kinase, barrel domain
MLWRGNYSMRRTKIVCTIGPATNSEAQLEQLMRAGMNVARLNFSHGAQQDHALVIERVRAISARLDFPIAILQDLQGPKIRVGSLKDGQPFKLVDGATLTITIRDVAGTSEIVSTTYKLLPQDLKPGDRNLPGTESAGPGSRALPHIKCACLLLWMRISFSIVLQRKTLMKNEVKEDGKVAVSAPV